MATRRIIVKTSKKLRGTVSRAAIRKAVETVFGAGKPQGPIQSPKVKRSGKSRAGIPQA